MRTLILAASAAALLAAPALAASKSATAKPVAAAPATPAAKAETKGESKMSQCAKQWKALGDKGHVAYNDKAKTMKSKKGGKMSGYNAWTAECMHKA